MTKVYLQFENVGEIDINAFRLIGASSKENDKTKIGFWGSGLKYGIACLLRHGVKVHAFSGSKEVKIGTRKTKMRDEIFDVVTINGTPTSITTRMGKDWELWFAIREIYANCIDEGEVAMTVTDNVSGSKGKTRIMIEFTDEVKAVVDEWDMYFSLKREAVVSCFAGKVFKRIADLGIVYRRGFRVGMVNSTLYDYDLENVEINESRVIKDPFNLNYELVKLWKESCTVEMVSNLFMGKCFERDMPWQYGSSVFNKNWLTVIGKRLLIPQEVAGYYSDDLTKPHVLLPTVLCQELAKHFKDKISVRGINANGDVMPYSRIAASKEFMAMIERSVSKLERIGLEGISSMEVIVARMDDQDILGTIEGDKIIISNKLQVKGERLLAETLMEEYVHVKSGCADRTRGFQDFIISLFLTSNNYDQI